MFIKICLYNFVKTKEMKWISVKDRLPETGKRVLVFGTWDDVHSAYFSVKQNAFFDDSFAPERNITEFITHWIPLPEPPKE